MTKKKSTSYRKDALIFLGIVAFIIFSSWWLFFYDYNPQLSMQKQQPQGTTCFYPDTDTFTLRIGEIRETIPSTSVLSVFLNQSDNGEITNLIFEQSVTCPQNIYGHFYPYNDSEVKTKVITTNKNKEKLFFESRENYYLVNILNPTYTTTGSINGEITGQIPVSKTFGGLFYTTSYISPSNINLKLNGDISLFTNVNYPTKELKEAEFYKMQEKYNKAVRCVEVTSNDYWMNNNHPYILFCAFDFDGIQFLTSINSITEIKDGCFSQITKTYYIKVDSGYSFTMNPTFQVRSNCLDPERTTISVGFG